MCKPSRVSLREEKDPSVSGLHFSQCTNSTCRSSLESSELLYCITHCSTAEERSEARQNLHSWAPSEQGKKFWQNSPLISPPSLYIQKRREGGCSDLGEELGCRQILEFKTVVWQQVAFYKMLHDSVSSEALQAEERDKNTSVITSDSQTFRQMHMLKNPTKML